MGLQFPSLSKLSRRWLVAIAILQLLLMGSAFVGGRMLGEQNARRFRTSGIQLPSELPRDPAAGTGSVQNIQDNVFTLAQGFGGGGRGGQSNNNTQTEVAVTAETKFYKNTSTGGGGGFGNPGGGQTQVQIADATLADVKIGNNVIVWGTKSGSRITAEVVYIQSGGR
jgi:hypothetical protein